MRFAIETLLAIAVTTLCLAELKCRPEFLGSRTTDLRKITNEARLLSSYVSAISVLVDKVVEFVTAQSLAVLERAELGKMARASK